MKKIFFAMFFVLFSLFFASCTKGIHFFDMQGGLHSKIKTTPLEKGILCCFSNKAISYIKEQIDKNTFATVVFDFVVTDDFLPCHFEMQPFNIAGDFRGGRGDTFSLGFTLSSAGDMLKDIESLKAIKITKHPNIQIQKVQLEKWKIGFDFKNIDQDAQTQNPCFYFANTKTQNQKIPTQNMALIQEGEAVSFDFSSSVALKEIYTKKNLAVFLPQITITQQNAQTQDFSFVWGKEVFSVRTQNKVYIPISAFFSPFDTIKIQNKNIKSVLLEMNDTKTQINDTTLQNKTSDILQPLECDVGLIIDWPKQNWRTQDYELFLWQSFPCVLVFDTKDYKVQSDFFKRLAFFAEKTGYKGSLQTDDFLKDKHGYNAHDYSANTLARFFDLAQKQNFPLNQKERLLKKILLFNGIIKETTPQKEGSGAFFVANRGAVISISQQSPKYLRRTFINHECWHGIYFTNSSFASFAKTVYENMDSLAKDFLTGYWSVYPSLTYDTQDKDLMINETMSYLMQQSISNCAAYFCHLATFDTVQKKLKPLADYVAQTRGAGFKEAADKFSSYAKQNWSLDCGRVWHISRDTLQ